MEMDDLINKAIHCLGVYSLALILVGTAGNIFNIYIILNTKLKRTTSFVFFCFLAVTDTISLYFWNLDHFLWPFFKIDRQNESIIWCRFDTFLEFAVLQSSAFFLVVISFDRYLSVKLTNWNKFYFKAKHALIVSIALIASLFGINLNIVFTFGFDQVVNGTRIVQCYSTDLDPSTKWMDIWGTVYSILYSLVPFILLSVSSALLICEINKKTRNVTMSVHRQKNQKDLNKMVVLFALLFVAMTAPGAIVTSFLNSFLQVSGNLGLLIITICDCITFSFHALNFLILYCTNRRFAHETRSYIRKRNISFESKVRNTITASRIVPKTTNSSSTKKF